MKTRLATFIFLLMILIISNKSYSQCTNGSSYGGGTAPSGGGSLTMSTCNYASEYAIVTGISSATNYQVTSSVGTDYITVRQGTFDGPLIASGVQPLNWTSTVAGDYYIHFNLDVFCNTDFACRTTVLTHVLPSIPMSFSSSTCTQNNVSNIQKCNTQNQEIIGVQVVTSGTLTPLSITQLRLRTNGSTSPLTDISNIDVYYTGTNSTFATTTLFGSSSPAGLGINIPINGTQVLANGTNYFWVVYDISASATSGNLLDAICNQITVNGSTYTPSITNPAGSRTIVYCPGDMPCTAYPITVGCGGAKISGDNSGMTNSGIPAPSCGSYAGGDVWYTVVVPTSGTIKIETYPLTLSDVGMAVYSASGGCSGTFTELACNDNSGFGNMAKITLYGQTTGTTLYVRVWDKNNDQTGTFEIDASDLVDNYCVTNDAIDEGDGCAQLTDALNGQQGSIWDSDDKLNFTADWSYDFTVNLGNNDGGADGICFVIQNDPTGLTAVGAMGGSMGSGGILNSLIIEIDTYLNTEDRNDGLTSVDCWSGSPDPDHLDIWLNGNVNPGDCSFGARVVPIAVELKNGASLYNIENGLDHTFRVSYISGSQTITAQILNLAGTVSYGSISYSPVNPLALFGTNAPYFGFTGSTGGLNNLQTACLAATLVLPIKLSEFEVNCLDKSVEVNWATATEVNNDYFTIERSSDGFVFNELGKVNGAGNSNSTIKYNWIDHSPLNGMAYYRLKQTDYDGSYEFFEMKSIQCYSNPNELSINSVNRADSRIISEFEVSGSGNYIIEVKDVTGRTLITLEKYFDRGENQIELFTSNLSYGMYFISIKNESISASRRFIIQ